MSNDQRHKIRQRIQSEYRDPPALAPTSRQDPRPDVDELVAKYAPMLTGATKAKPIIDQHGNRWASANLAADAIEKSAAGILAAIRNGKPYFGVRYWFEGDAPVKARRMEAA